MSLWHGGCLSSVIGRYRKATREAVGSTPPEYLVSQPDHRVVLAVGCALLHRDQRVVGDLDVLRAYLGAALGDVAEAEAVFVLRLLGPALHHVERVHVEFRLTHQIPRAGESLLVLLVVTHDVAGVLAQEALDALAEL